MDGFQAASRRRDGPRDARREEHSPVQAYSDAELVAQFVAEGHATAFDVLHERHYRWVCARLRRQGLGHADAADVAQEALVRAYRSAARFDPQRGAFTTWLGAIARNCLIRHFTRNARQTPADAMALAESLPAPDADPVDLAASAEEVDAVDDCVGKLPEQLRRIVRLRYAGGLTTRAIAASVGISEGSVRNRLTEAGELLRRCLGGKGIL